MKLIVPEKLTRGLSGEKKAAVMEGYKSAAWLLRRLQSILQKDLAQRILESEADDKLNLTNYGLYQAKSLGYRQGLRACLALLPQNEEEDTDGREEEITLSDA